MKRSAQRTVAFFAPIALAAAVFGVAGCASTPPSPLLSTPQVDWNSRVGHFTFDQAVTELGPPDKQAKTPDGKTVAEWTASRNGGASSNPGNTASGGHGAAADQSVGSADQLKITRLTFDAAGKLVSWFKN